MGYIAAFVSSLFGKTYKQSLKAAKGMGTLAKKTSAAGAAAKRAVAGFDVFNDITEQKDGGAGGADVAEAWTLTLTTRAENIKIGEVWKTMFADIGSAIKETAKSIKDLWNNSGLKTIVGILAGGVVVAALRLITRRFDGVGRRLKHSVWCAKMV